MGRVKGFYTDDKGRTRPITERTRHRHNPRPTYSVSLRPSRQKSMFFPPKSKRVAKNIGIANEAEAHASAEWLNQQWRKTKSRSRRRNLIRYANLARNRARVIANNPRVTPHERRESEAVAKIYDRWIETHPLPPQ